jgi:hypothetical protein
MPSKAKITDLYGVYDADATILGEISYWLGARIGIRHCTLCDITHSMFFKKAAWKDCQVELLEKYGVNFQTFHRNDQLDQVAKVINGAYPAVVARDINGNFTLFMSDPEISVSGDSPHRFMAEIIKRLPKP